MRRLRFWALALILPIFVGCASIAKPQSFDQQLAYAQGTITSVRQTTIDLLDRGRISKERALSINAEADKARSYVRSARSLGNTQAGQDKLQLALNLLVTLEAQLKEAQ